MLLACERSLSSWIEIRDRGGSGRGTVMLCDAAVWDCRVGRSQLHFSWESDSRMSHEASWQTLSQAKMLTNAGSDDKHVMNRTVCTCSVCPKSPSLSGLTPTSEPVIL